MTIGPAAPPAQARLLTFTLGGQRYGLRSEAVDEIVRVQRLTRVPHAPPALLGLTNLRGSVLPVLSLARLLQDRADSATRIIVINDEEPVGLAVDQVNEMVSADAAAGVIVVDAGEMIARGRGGVATRRSRAGGMAEAEAPEQAEAGRVFIGFAIGAQEFALPLAMVDGVGVEEAGRLPEAIAAMPYADAAVIGSAPWRGALLPLLSLRVLLGFGPAPPSEKSRILVVRIGPRRIGFVVDALRSVTRVPETAIDPVPQALSRGSAEARIQAICRLDGGTRLMSVLAADRLLREDVTASLLADEGNDSAMAASTDHAPAAGEQFVLFRIGADDFALPVAAVEEVAPLPDRMARLPKAPAFVAGVINLRGEVIPVIDQAARFGAAASRSARRRIIVTQIDDLRAGFVVDEVSEVMRLGQADLRPAPDLGHDETRVFERIANLPEQDRIVLIVSPRELLSRMERDVLRAMGTTRPSPRS